MANLNNFIFIFPLICILLMNGCGSDAESKDNRPQFYISIQNASGATFSCTYVEYNENYQFEIGRSKYESRIIDISAGSTSTIIAYPQFNNSGMCEVKLGFNGDVKGLIFYENDAIRNYKILPGLLGSPGSG